MFHWQRVGPDELVPPLEQIGGYDFHAVSEAKCFPYSEVCCPHKNLLLFRDLPEVGWPVVP
jgi:hypothetical protein